MRIHIHRAAIGLSPGQGLRRFSGNLPALHQRLGGEYLLMVQDCFEHERGPDGAPWRPLSPATARRKAAKGHRRGYHPILRVSGRLANVHVRADERRAEIGSNLVYAPIHQFGGRAGKGRKAAIPARPWLFGRDGGVPRRFLDHLAAIVRKELGQCLS